MKSGKTVDEQTSNFEEVVLPDDELVLPVDPPFETEDDSDDDRSDDDDEL